MEKFKTVKEAKGLSVGKKVNTFVGEDIYGNKISLSELTKEKPVVLIFIRGQWCPICNKHLKNLQENLPKIYDKGANVVVVSPEKSEFIKRTIEKTGAEFTIIYDEGYKISNQFDVTFVPDRMSKFMYNTILGAKLKQSHSDDTERLPIPATFIIDKNQVIVWRHFDPDYKKRSTMAEIIANIP